MILYVCERCGRWQDATLGAYFARLGSAIVASLKQSASTEILAPEQQSVPCPYGCGLMHLVTPDERLKVWKQWNQETDHVAITVYTEETPSTGSTALMECP